MARMSASLKNNPWILHTNRAGMSPTRAKWTCLREGQKSPEVISRERGKNTTKHYMLKRESLFENKSSLFRGRVISTRGGTRRIDLFLSHFFDHTTFFCASHDQTQLSNLPLPNFFVITESKVKIGSRLPPRRHLQFQPRDT